MVLQSEDADLYCGDDDSSNAEEPLHPFEEVMPEAGDDDDNFELARRLTGIAQPGDSRVFEFSPEYLGGHVLLNKHARLLVRRHGKLIRTRQQRSFLEKIVSASQQTLPLVYPEGMLFYSIFWDSLQDGSIIGAIPTALLCGNSYLRRLNIASLHDHLRCRLMNTTLLTSADYRYQFFALDQLVNLGCREHDTRLILNRGFGECMSSSGIRMIPNQETQFYRAETLEARPIVQQLASAIGERMATWFYTHTVSMKNHVVMNHLKAYLESQEAIEDMAEEMGVRPEELAWKDRERIKLELISSYASVLVRVWANISSIWIHYICHSPEKPVGTVYWSFTRNELQELVSNLFHTHSIFWILEDDGDADRLFDLLERVRASISGMASRDEIDEYMAEGVVQGARQPLAQSNSSGTCFIYIDVEHSEMAEKLLVDLGLVVRVENQSDLIDHNNFRHLYYVDKSLEAKRYVPPTSAQDSVLSPVFARLVIINPNSDNAQYLDSYGVSKYLAKYVTSVDETARVYLSAPSAQLPNRQKISVQETGNTKITSVKVVLEKESKKKRKQVNSIARMMTQTECLMLHFGIPAVITNIRYVHISTTALEERPAFDRSKPLKLFYKNSREASQISKLADIDEKKALPVLHARSSIRTLRGLAKWRKHTEVDILTAKDQLLCPMTLDSVTLFSLRPPELSMIRHQSQFHRWFSRQPLKFSQKEREGKTLYEVIFEYCEKSLSPAYDRCVWIDSANYWIRVRRAALPEIIAYLQACPVKCFGNSHREKSTVQGFFEKLHRMYCESTSSTGLRSSARRFWEFATTHFLCELDQNYLPVIWYTPIKPTQTNRFLFHVLLSMGSFRSETELLMSGSMRDAFQHAGLFDSNDPEGSVKKVTKTYLLKQLQHLPGGTRQFDRMLLAANKAFHNLFFDNTLAAQGLPPALYTKLIDETTKKVRKQIQNMTQSMCKCLLATLQATNIAGLPELDKLIDSQTNGIIPFDIGNIEQSQHQPDASFVEQQFARIKIKEKVSQYTNAYEFSPKCPVLIGDPGAGKTTTMLFGICIHLHVAFARTSRPLSVRGLRNLEFCTLPNCSAFPH
ncbi:hypothetical protein SEMRO_512_G157630.1 [Seminavis robusta]|uniref:Uncharacterized protein n=1 Tax=Seminavis robusta TaxID=568900 RepID=A0A9N8HH05_9STRA|nr:hypothetical protein SEMRO_512_G157630.1 [Seminavis robusta]|eukprot:Sro512_g157630.1 n/a (1084) ;mRNA; f:29472-32962